MFDHLFVDTTANWKGAASSDSAEFFLVIASCASLETSYFLCDPTDLRVRGLRNLVVAT